MKLARFLSIASILLGFVGQSAFAGSTLKIFGGGVANRDGDSIALVCTGSPAEEGSPCTRVQFAYFEHGSMMDPVPIGSSYRLKDPTGKPADEAELVRRTMKMVKIFMKNHQRQGKVGFGLGAMILSIGVGGAIAVAINSGIPAMLGVVVWAICASKQCDPAIFDPTAKVSNAFLKDKIIQEAILDQNGWNWPDRPRVLKSKAFKRFYDTIASGSSDGVFVLPEKW